MARKRFSQEFMEQAVSLLRKGDRSAQEIAAHVGVSSWTLRSWDKKMKDAPEKSDEAPITKEELRRLRKENQDLKMENAILKKFAAILSKEQI